MAHCATLRSPKGARPRVSRGGSFSYLLGFQADLDEARIVFALFESLPHAQGGAATHPGIVPFIEPGLGSLVTQLGLAAKFNRDRQALIAEFLLLFRLRHADGLPSRLRVRES